MIQPGAPIPGGADININLDVTFVSTILQFSYTHPHTETQNGAFEVNGVTFEPPTVPVLLQILSGASNASDLLPAGSIYGLSPNKSVELTIPGGVLNIPVSVHGLLFK